MVINIEKLRKDLIDYYGTGSMNWPVAQIDVFDLENASDEEVYEFAVKKKVNLNKYIIEMDDYER